MVEVVPPLAEPLAAYTCREVSFTQFHDTISRRAQIISDQSTEEGIELLLEIYACIYEVQDGVMPEATFRQAIQKFLAKQNAPQRRTAIVLSRSSEVSGSTYKNRHRRIRSSQRSKTTSYSVRRNRSYLSRHRSVLTGYRR